MPNLVTTTEGALLDSLRTPFNMKQMITEPTHILENTSSYIDVIFTTQPNIIVDSGIHSSLHPKCHHQIICSKLNLKIEYPPPYTREIWDYNKTETELIALLKMLIGVTNLFQRKNVHEPVEIFNQTILNIFHNFIPNKTILCDDRDPPWINEKIKSFIRKKNPVYHSQRKSINFDYTTLDAMTLEVSNATVLCP